MKQPNNSPASGIVFNIDTQSCNTEIIKLVSGLVFNINVVDVECDTTAPVELTPVDLGLATTYDGDTLQSAGTIALTQTVSGFLYDGDTVDIVVTGYPSPFLPIATANDGDSVLADVATTSSIDVQANDGDYLVSAKLSLQNRMEASANDGDYLRLLISDTLVPTDYTTGENVEIELSTNLPYEGSATLVDGDNAYSDLIVSIRGDIFKDGENASASLTPEYRFVVSDMLDGENATINRMYLKSPAILAPQYFTDGDNAIVVRPDWYSLETCTAHSLDFGHPTDDYTSEFRGCANVDGLTISLSTKSTLAITFADGCYQADLAITTDPTVWLADGESVCVGLYVDSYSFCAPEATYNAQNVYFDIIVLPTNCNTFAYNMLDGETLSVRLGVDDSLGFSLYDGDCLQPDQAPTYGIFPTARDAEHLFTNLSTTSVITATANDGDYAKGQLAELEYVFVSGEHVQVSLTGTIIPPDVCIGFDPYDIPLWWILMLANPDLVADYTETGNAPTPMLSGNCSEAGINSNNVYVEMLEDSTIIWRK